MTAWKRQRYLFITLDPVHVGTGGYRLGRVDNSIVREPGTRVPKIPGTSLHGAARAHAAYLYEIPEAAGQNHDQIAAPDKNPVCYTFGYIGQGKAYSGVVSIFDAHIVLFPVYSMVGPVWVSTVERLAEAGFIVKQDEEEQKQTPPDLTPEAALLTLQRRDPLNLGWLMVNVGGQATVEAPEEWQGDRWNAVKDHIALVHESLFSHIVNSNLEVRTSVSIDPKTGAAEEGALFTYEAIPRATFLAADVVLDDYRANERGWLLETVGKTGKDHDLPGGPWSGPLDVVRAGFGLIEWLGIGGMGTRGFGRMAVVGKPHEAMYGGVQQASA
jgi:CRISPR-associated protein Cmr4